MATRAGIGSWWGDRSVIERRAAIAAAPVPPLPRFREPPPEKAPMLLLAELVLLPKEVMATVPELM